MPIPQQVLFRFPNLSVYKSLDIEHCAEGCWEDLHHGCRTVGGPRFPAESRDLSAKPLVIPLELTERFQFNTPGTYTIRFSTDIGVNDDSNPIVDFRNPPTGSLQPHSVNVSSELQLEILPDSAY